MITYSKLVNGRMIVLDIQESENLCNGSNEKLDQEKEVALDIQESENLHNSSNEKKNQEKKSQIEKFFLKILVFIIAIAVLLFAIVLVLKYFEKIKKAKEPVVETSATATLMSEKDLAELQVADLQYNSIASIDKDGMLTQKYYSNEKEEKKEIAGYLSYEGKITVSYDMNKIKFSSYSEETKTYTVELPKPILHSVVTSEDPKKMILDKDFSKNYSPIEAKKLCEQDLAYKLKAEHKELEQQADENLKTTIDEFLGVFGYKAVYKTSKEVVK